MGGSMIAISYEDSSLGDSPAAEGCAQLITSPTLIDGRSGDDVSEDANVNPRCVIMLSRAEHRAKTSDAILLLWLNGFARVRASKTGPRTRDTFLRINMNDRLRRDM